MSSTTTLKAISDLTRGANRFVTLEEIRVASRDCTEDDLIALEHDGLITFTYRGAQRAYCLLPKGADILENRLRSRAVNITLITIGLLTLIATILFGILGLTMR